MRSPTNQPQAALLHVRSVTCARRAGGKALPPSDILTGYLLSATHAGIFDFIGQLTADQISAVEKLSDILFGYSTRKRREMIERKGRFVHYTSAENALSIIRNKCLWMRNTNCMSDYREVHHGFDVLRRFFGESANREAFSAALNGCFAGIAEDVIAQFDQSLQSNQLQTYISSISEHDDDEDIHGRLSMWRAFGNSTARVALVIKVNLELGLYLNLGAELSPVAYFTDREFADELQTVIARIRQNQQFLTSIGRQGLLNSVLTMLTSAMVCLKHEGFQEEREWRVIHQPLRHSSQHITSSIETVAGVPQRVYKLPLRNDAETGLTGIDLDQLLDRIIIGPTQYPYPMFEAFGSALAEAGVKEAFKLVVNSQIPMRT
jgi:hypothetical protein